MAEGWVCPSCKCGVAPDQKFCDHAGAAPQVTPVYPAYPQPWTPADHWRLPWWPSITCGGTNGPEKC